MPAPRSLLTLAAAASTASAAAFQGFNYGATFSDGSLKREADFEADFRTAANLEGTDGAFTSARLYTMIQGGSDTSPIEAIPAAIKTKTSILFGLWASAGDEIFNNEITALQNTIDQYCDQLDGLVAGISVGSEDLYRITPIGMKDNLPGASPETLVGYIDRVRETIKGTCLSNAPIGHVDTWTAYVNGSNQAVIEACDWLGMDTYPYFETNKANGIDNGPELFKAALDKTKNAGGGKDVWITETGWPVSGDKANDAVANTKNARQFWVDVGCPMFGNTNVWWYTLQDTAPTTPNPSFGVVGSQLTEKPLYDLSCDDLPATTSSKPAPKPTTEAKPIPKPTTEDKPAPKPTTTEDGAETTSEAKTSAQATSSAAAESTTSAAPSSMTTPSASSTSAPVSMPGTNSSTPASSNGGAATTSLPSGTTGGADEPTNVPAGAPGNFNSMSAAVVAMVLAIGLL